MSVKLPATLNIQPEYALLHLGKCTKFVGTIILLPSNYSLETLSATIKTVGSARSAY